MIGWHMRWDSVVQIIPGFVPMQFNTALAFFLAAVALMASEAHRPRLGMAAAALAGLLTAAVGLQYAAGMNFGIDTLFFDPYLQARTTHPGRMAPNTALCFVFYALALIYRHRSKQPENAFNVLSFCGITLGLVGCIVLGGYAAKVEAAYSWWGISDMAPQTATMFAVLGAGILAHTGFLSRRPAAGQRLRLWVPAYAALGGIVLTLLIAQGILMFQKRHALETAAFEAKRFAAIIDVELRRLALGSLGRMTERWDLSGNTGKDAWKSDAANFIRDNNAFHSLALLDAPCKAAETVPQDQATAAFWQEACNDNAAWTDVARMVRVPGQPVMVAFRKPFKNGKGYIASAYKIEETLLALAGAAESSRFHYELRDGGGEMIFSRGTRLAEQAGWGSSAQQTLSAGGLDWSLDVAVDVASFRENGLVMLVVLFGITLSCMFSHALYQIAKTRDFRRRLEAVMEQMVDGLVTIDVDGVITSYNRACEKIFGYPAAEVVGQKVNILMPEEHARQHDQYLSNYHSTGKKKIIGIGRELEGRRKDGSTFPMDLSVAEVRLGRERLYSGIIRDMTERKEREQEMILMRSNAELSQFAYIASHDLKAPLRGIQKLALWIAEDIGEALTPQAKEQFELLHKRVARLEAMLEDILRYSRVGRITEDPETISIGELLAQVASPVAMDGKFAVRYEGRMPVMTIHRTPLEQVFTNLIVNAVKHHDLGTGTLTLGVIPRGRYYEFYVQDDGPGIPPQFHEKVFQIFQTLQPRDKKEGVGLGMAIVKKLVEWQGGRVWIESPVAGGRGTAFHFLWRDQNRDQTAEQQQQAAAS